MTIVDTYTHPRIVHSSNLLIVIVNIDRQMTSVTLLGKYEIHNIGMSRAAIKLVTWNSINYNISTLSMPPLVLACKKVFS